MASQGRLHGKNGVWYIAITSGGTPQQINYLNKWSIKFTTDKKDVTAFGDTNKVYVAGLPDASGDYGGFYDDSTAQLYTASQDGVARKFYLYPTSATSGQYWYGTAFFDFNVDGGVTDSVNVSGTWNAASAITKIG